MLQLRTEHIDVCHMGKLLAQYNINAHISQTEICIEGDKEDIINELLQLIQANVKVISFKNLESKIASKSTETNQENTSFSKNTSSSKNTGIHLTRAHKYPLRYYNVKYGEVYICDFGEPFGSEIGYIRPAIIVQDDYFNDLFNTTLVLPCTSQIKPDYPVNFSFHFSFDNMSEYDNFKFNNTKSTIMGNRVREIDKKRLRKYLGKMSPEFMKQVQENINTSFRHTSIVDVSLNDTMSSKDNNT